MNSDRYDRAIRLTLVVAFVVGLLAFLEWAIGMGRFFTFGLVTALLLLALPLWLRGRIYKDRTEPIWVGRCSLGLLFVWIAAQWFYVATVPLELTPEQISRGNFVGFLFLIPSIIFHLLVQVVFPLALLGAVCLSLFIALQKWVTKLFRYWNR